jgi:BASS family bile acid:Na+ symporter
MVEVLTTLLAIMIFFISVGLGASVSFDDFRRVFGKPRAFLAGFGSQYGFMPFCAWALAQIFSLPNAEAIGLILIGSAPGGTTSNLITYWVKGDVALSISMTAASTIAALGALPLMIIIYIETSFRSDEFEIPFANIFLSLGLLVVSCAIGVFVRYKSDRVASIVEKISSAMGGVFLVAALVFGIVDNKDVFDQPFSTYFCCITLMPLGTGFGYGISWLLGLTRREQRTVAIETGLQNTPLIIAMIGISYADNTELRDELLIVPYIFSLFLVVNAVWITIFFRFVLVPLDKSQAPAPQGLERQNTDTLDKYNAEVGPVAPGSNDDLRSVEFSASGPAQAASSNSQSALVEREKGVH